MRFNNFWLLSLALILVSGSAAAGPFDTQEKRDARGSQNNCKSTLKKQTRFLKYWKPENTIATNLVLYRTAAIYEYEIRGDIYFSGCAKADLEADASEAAYWYLVGANFHVPSSQFKLGKMLYEGDGIPKDEPAGIDWLTSAALENNSEAKSYLSNLGIDVPKVQTTSTFDTLRAEAIRLHKQNLADTWNTVLELTVLAASTYVVVQSANPPSVQARNSTLNSSQGSTKIQRFKPTWCTSSLMGSANSFAGYTSISGTVNTFCN